MASYYWRCLSRGYPSDCTVRNGKPGNSFLGAVDMVGLVMVSAGITLANIVSPRDKGEAVLAAPGFAINMGLGTFVKPLIRLCFPTNISLLEQSSHPD
ncbi:hypothetical protein [Bacillus sp. ISL-7]|uniref:hypothetical protein n=1 Tax=Bacillus sp. ISL-7 TaxID=2819136 RepID=UPI00203507C9|nr:hypothetical protein [Bacillus sp. ISL-7]